MSNESEFARASAVLPGGVNSPVRAFGSVGGTPRFFVEGSGAWVTDVEGKRYVDLVGSWGPALLGHARVEVVEAVQAAASRGFGFGASHPSEAKLAEIMGQRMHRNGITALQKVRLVGAGTEATMTAVRLARGATGRDLILKFSGHYHGHSDSLLVEAGSGLATLGMPGSAGITTATAAQTIVVPYNDLAAVEAAFALHGDRLAAVIVEAAAANMGVVPPLPGFNASLTRIAHSHGALVISDEVLTGFRSSESGWWGIEADGEHPFDPDLMTFGKVIGGGLPLAALGGRADLMDLLAPLGAVYQAGTLSGNPVALAAGVATLELATPQVYEGIGRASTLLSEAVSKALSAEGVAHSIQRAGTLFSVAFVDAPPHNFDEARAQESFRYAPFFHAMLGAGVSLPPSVFEAWFVSAAHDDDALGVVLEALPGAAKAAAAARP